MMVLVTPTYLILHYTVKGLQKKVLKYIVESTVYIKMYVFKINIIIITLIFLNNELH